MEKLKGISLSVETIIIITICILVFTVIILFFTGIFKIPSKSLYTEAELNAECMEWSYHNYDFKEFGNYTKLKNTYKIAPIAKSWCESRTVVNYIECSEDKCDMPSPNSTWKCYCKDCDRKEDCKWSPPE